MLGRVTTLFPSSSVLSPCPPPDTNPQSWPVTWKGCLPLAFPASGCPSCRGPQLSSPLLMSSWVMSMFMLTSDSNMTVIPNPHLQPLATPPNFRFQSCLLNKGQLRGLGFSNSAIFPNTCTYS